MRESPCQSSTARLLKVYQPPHLPRIGAVRLMSEESAATLLKNVVCDLPGLLLTSTVSSFVLGMGSFTSYVIHSTMSS